MCKLDENCIFEIIPIFFSHDCTYLTNKLLDTNKFWIELKLHNYYFRLKCKQICYFVEFKIRLDQLLEF